MKEDVLHKTGDSIIQLNLSLLLPKMDAGDRCERLLTEQLSTVNGIKQAHIVQQNGQAELCMHFDPNRFTLNKAQRLAQDAGASITDRYRHEQIPIGNMMSADTAPGLADVLSKLPGVLHARVNFAAGLVFVAYDSTQIQRAAIEQTIRNMGVRVWTNQSLERAPTKPDAQHEDEHKEGHDTHAGHDHGTAPTFLPHWMQERWRLILVALCGLFLAIGFFGETFFGLSPTIALVFYILAYIAGGYDITLEAVPMLLKGKFSTDILMIAAAIGAAILGEWPEGAFLLFLFSLGHAGEHYALDRARNAVSALGELMPQTAQVERNNQIVTLNVSEVQVGDTVMVRPGDRVPVDGVVKSGGSNVDQAPITGESIPVKKEEGDEVFAGTINQDAALVVKVTKLAKDNTLARVMKLVEEAQSQQSPTQQFIDRFTQRFVPAVFIIVVLVITIPPLVNLMPLSESFYKGMLLLVAASPCALALGVPAAILAGVAQAARNGVLIKGGVHLENMGALKAIAFDKTGTLTHGKFGVTDVVTFNGTSRADVLRIAATVEQQSSHPLAQAIVRAAKAENIDLQQADGLENVPGKGVKSSVNGQPVLIGSPKLFLENAEYALPQTILDAVTLLDSDSKTTMVVSQSGKFIGVIGLADTLRKDIDKTMAKLRQLGVEHLVMLTGDKKSVAEKIATQSGLTDVEAELLPEDKLTRINALQQKFGNIGMVGDGVNDAPALATATVGIAMGGAGTAVALETADVALMADDVSKLPFAVGLSRFANNIIRQNVVIALGVIVLLIIATFVGILELPLAVLFHEGSTIVVVLNALRLLAFRE
jgi:Cd2+/Zn2+-exporting ATPase